MFAQSCPFCGATTDLPHETQQACIAALQAEIAVVRGFVNRIKDPEPARSPAEPPPIPAIEPPPTS